MRECLVMLPLLLALTVIGAGDADACTTFSMPGKAGASALVGKSYDWSEGAGLVMHNKANVAKKSLAIKPGDVPLRWTSRHASLTFNQYGRELPNGGMNEAGLVVEIMWLDESRYPESDARPSLNELQWIQYQLDHFTTVDEVVAHAPVVRVSPVHAAVHYLACDKSGACAAFEYLDGELEIFHGDRLPAPALTNDTVPASAAYLRSHRGFGGELAPRPSASSLDRYVRAATSVQREGDVARAFDLLRGVGQGDYSQWNIVYDPQRLRVHFRTRSAPAIKVVSLADFDRACSSPVEILDIDHPRAGAARSAFAPYSRARNQALLERTMGALNLPAFMVNLAASFPDQFACVASTR